MAKILIVDDTRLARVVTVACLRKAGHEALEVEPTSLFDVIKALKAELPDLLVMDVLMPLCPGLHLVRACRADPALASLRILALTALRDAETNAQLQDLGVAGPLYKPFEPIELTGQVEALLAG